MFYNLFEILHLSDFSILLPLIIPTCDEF
jgi:hypothetical protein